MSDEKDEKLEPETEKADSGVVGEKERGFLQKSGLFVLELIKLAIIAGITIGLVRYFLFKPFYVKGQSMEPNFEEKDYLIIDEITYRFREPERGEVVVLRAPLGNGDYYLKRIVGLPGERVKIDDNKVVIYNESHPQGLVMEESYLTEETAGSMIVTLGLDEYFVLGDNRNSSFDSRRFGPAKRNDIVGKTWLRGWPLTRISKFETPSYNL